MFETDNRLNFVVKGGIPQGARLFSAVSDERHDALYLFVEHESFEEVEDGVEPEPLHIDVVRYG